MMMRQDPTSIWKPLPGYYGEFFSVQGKAVAGVQANRFIVWQDGEKKYEVLSSIECGSYARWSGSVIFWNDNRLDMQTGKIYNLDIMKRDFLENPDMPVPSVTTGTGYRPVTCAWAPHADFFVVSAEGSDKNSMAHSRVLLLEIDGSLKKNLWEGYDFAPKALCINGDYIIAGTREPMIFDHDGELLFKLPGELISQRIHISDSGSILLIQTYESVTLWETGTWIRKDIIKGPWLNAALSPDGDLVYAVSFEGKLFLAPVSDTIGEIQELAIPAPIATVDAGSEYIIASFAREEPVRWALKKDLESSLIKNL
jgi:hypothetical protein